MIFCALGLNSIASGSKFISDLELMVLHITELNCENHLDYFSLGVYYIIPIQLFHSIQNS